MFDAIVKKVFRGTRRSSRKNKCPRDRQLGLEYLEYRRMLATVTVTTVEENPSNSRVDDGEITMREAVQYVNGDFDPVPNGLDEQHIAGEFARNDPAETDTIIFDGSVTGMISLGLNSEISISRPVTIEGPGSGVLTIDASGNDNDPGTPGNGTRVFDVNFSLHQATRLLWLTAKKVLH